MFHVRPPVLQILCSRSLVPDDEHVLRVLGFGALYGADYSRVAGNKKALVLLSGLCGVAWLWVPAVVGAGVQSAGQRCPHGVKTRLRLNHLAGDFGHSPGHNLLKDKQKRCLMTTT